MKTQLVLATLFVSLQCPFCFDQAAAIGQKQAAQAQNKACFSIHVEEPLTSPEADAVINIPLTVANISGKDIYWSYAKTNTPYKAFHVVLKKDGHDVETTVFHRKMTGKQRPDDPQEIEGGDSIALPLAAGKSFTWTIDLSKLYIITEPGQYDMYLSRFDDCSKSEIRSNTLTINIR